MQQYLLHEIQNVYRAQRVTIDDKHLEIIISRMLSKVMLEDVGDTNLLTGIVLDKLTFQQINEETSVCVKVVDSGDTDFQPATWYPWRPLKK